MFPFLPFLTLPECSCSRCLKRSKSNDPTANYKTAKKFSAHKKAPNSIPSRHSIKTTEPIRISSKTIQEHSHSKTDIDNKDETEFEDATQYSQSNFQLNGYSGDLLAALNTQKSQTNISPSAEIRKDEVSISKNKSEFDQEETALIQNGSDELNEESASHYIDDVWPQQNTKPRFSAEFSMSSEMSFAVGDLDETIEDEERMESEMNEDMVTQTNNKVKSATEAKTPFGDSEHDEKKKLNDVIREQTNPDISGCKSLDEVIATEMLLNIESPTNQPNLQSQCSSPASSRCSSVATSSSMVIPANKSGSNSPRQMTSSPSNLSKSPKPDLSKVPVNTPPAVRAAKARQLAFQPSKAMMDLFCSDSDEPSTSSTINTTKKSKTASMLSQPGPELVEPDAPDVIVTTPENERDSKKSIKAKRIIRKNGIEGGAETEDAAVMAKMQLSDPGPEMASENEEIEDSGGAERDGEANEYVKNEDELVTVWTKVADNEQNENNGMEEIADSACKNDEINECYRDYSDNQTTIEDDEEAGDIEIVIEYDAFGRRFEREVRKKKEKSRNAKIGEKIRLEEKQKGSETKKAHEINNAVQRQQQQKQQQNARVGATRSMHDNKDNNSNGSAVAAAIQHLTSAQLTNGDGRNHSNNKKAHNISANAWNADNYRHTSGRHAREAQHRQQHNAVADTLKETSQNASRRDGRDSDTTAGGCYSSKTAESHNASQLRNLGDRPTRKTPVSSPRTATRTGGHDKAAIRHNGPSFDHSASSSSIQPRIAAGGGGGSGGSNGAEDASNMQNGNTDAAGAAGIGGGTAECVILIRQANVINEDEIFSADILIEDGVITKIADEISIPTNAEVVEAAGCWLLPAGIDVHTQFSREFAVGSAFANGTKSALMGGTTTIIEAVRARSGESLAAAIDRVRRSADANTKCNYGVSMIVGGTWNEQIQGQMTEVVCEKGVNSFLLDFSSDAGLIEALNHARQLGALCCLLPENTPIVNLLNKHNRANDMALVKLEAERVQRFCVFSQLTNAPFTLLCPHINAKVSEALHSGRADGAHVNAEIPLKALACVYGNIESKSETDYALEVLADSTLPMIVSNDMSELWEAQNTQSSTVSSGSTGGMLAAIENRLSLLWEHGVIGAARLDPMRFVAVTSANLAKTFNIFPKKGRVSVGSDADLVLWNFETSRKLGNSNVSCTPSLVICGGEIVVRNGCIVNSEVKNATKESSKTVGAKFVNLPPHSPYLFSVVNLKEKTFNLAQLSLAAKKNVKLSMAVTAPGTSRRTSLASCTSAATTSDAIISNERKPSSVSVGHSNDVTNRPITAGTKNRNVQSTNPPKRSATKVIQPPGGLSTKFW